MSPNPVERNVVTRFLLGLVVVLGMMLGGAAGGSIASGIGVPYGDVGGVLLGAASVFLAFAAWYTRYDRRVRAGAASNR